MRGGEVQAARAAQAAGVQFTLSTVGCCPLREVSAGAPEPFWFQLYVTKDRGFMREMIAQAVALDCPVLFFTVDLPVPGSRYRDVHSGLTAAPGFRGRARRFAQALGKPRWLWDVGINGRPHALGNVAHLLDPKAGMLDFLTWSAANFDATLTWKDVDFIRSLWPRKFVIKGILDPRMHKAAARRRRHRRLQPWRRQLDGVSRPRALCPPSPRRWRRTTILATAASVGLDVVRMLALGADGGRSAAPGPMRCAQGGAGVARCSRSSRPRCGGDGADRSPGRASTARSRLTQGNLNAKIVTYRVRSRRAQGRARRRCHV